MLAVYEAMILAQTGGSVFDYFGQSNLAGKVIVILLVLFSLVAWTVMIGKYLDLSVLQSLNITFEKKLLKTEQLLSISVPQKPETYGPYAMCTFAAIQAAFRYESDTPEGTRLRIAHMENALQRSVARETMRYESIMIVLGSIVTGAPFMGLLGTVWGVMDAFGSLGSSGSASIQNLAPGVSGALLTTVAGLVVAIPSVFGYNFLLQPPRNLVHQLENFSTTNADRNELEMAAEAMEK